MGKHEEVMEMVRRQLKRDPPPPTAALYGRAAVLDPEIYQLSLRQFHAKYPLRVKRERAREERARQAARANGEPDGGDVGVDAGTAGAGVGPEDRADGTTGADGTPGGGDRRPTGCAVGVVARERVRSVLYRLARDVAAAEGAADLAAVVGELPDRVDEVEAILAGAGQGA